MYTLSHRINVSTLSSMSASPLPLPFRDTSSIILPSLGWKALYIVISFLVLWSICLTFSFVYYKNSLEYLTKGTAQVLSLWRYFCYIVWFRVVSHSPEIIFFNFSFISNCLMVSAYNIPKLFKSILSSLRSDFFFLWYFYFFCQLSFSAFHYLHGT